MGDILKKIWDFLTIPPKSAPAVRGYIWGNVTDICLVVAMIGIMMRMFGEERWSKRLTGISFLAAIVIRVMVISG